jgi:hypothetical protein
MIVEEAESRGDLSLRAWIRKGAPETSQGSVDLTGPSYGPRDRDVREFLSMIRSLGAEAWIHGVLAVRLRQEPAEVEAAWLRLTVAIDAVFFANNGELADPMRAADQQAVAVIEANLPKDAVDTDAARTARALLLKTTRRAVHAVMLRDGIDAASFATLFAPFAGIAEL